MLILILIKPEFLLIGNILEQWFLLDCLERKHLLLAELLSDILLLGVQSTCPLPLSLIDFYNGYKQCLDIDFYLFFFNSMAMKMGSTKCK